MIISKSKRNGSLNFRLYNNNLSSTVLKNYYFMDQITSCYAIDDIHSADDLPEDGVTSVQMRLRRVCDEKLAPASVLAGECHPDRTASVRPGVDLAADLIAGSPFAIAARIAPLNNEIRYDAMKSQ